MLTGVRPEDCHIWLMTGSNDTRETLVEELEASRLGHNLQLLGGAEVLQERLFRLGDGSVLAESAAPHMLLLSLEDNDSLCDLMRSVRATPGLQTLPVIVLVSEGHSLDLRRAYGSGINSVVPLPRERGRRHEVLKVLADYWLDVVPLARSRP